MPPPLRTAVIRHSGQEAGQARQRAVVAGVTKARGQDMHRGGGGVGVGHATLIRHTGSPGKTGVN